MKKHICFLLVLLCFAAAFACAEDEYYDVGFNAKYLMPGTWCSQNIENESGWRYTYRDGSSDIIGAKQEFTYDFLDIRDDGTAYYLDLYQLVTQYKRTGYINRQVFTWKQVGDCLELTNIETDGSWDFKCKDVGEYDKFTVFGESFNKTTDTTTIRSYLLGEWHFAGLEMSDALLDGGLSSNTIVFQDDYTFTMSASALSDGQEVHGVYLVANHGVYLYLPELELITSIDFSADLQTLRFNYGFGTGIDLYYARDLERIGKIGLNRNLIGTYWTGSDWFGSEEERQIGIYFIDEHYATLVINKRTSKKEVVYGYAAPWIGYTKKVDCIYTIDRNKVRIEGKLGYDSYDIVFEPGNAAFAEIDGTYNAPMMRTDLADAIPYLGTWQRTDGQDEFVFRSDLALESRGTSIAGTPFDATLTYMLINGRIVCNSDVFTLAEDKQKLIYVTSLGTYEYVRSAPAASVFSEPVAIPTLPPPLVVDMDLSNIANPNDNMEEQSTPTPPAVTATPIPSPTATPAATATARPLATPTPIVTPAVVPTVTATPAASATPVATNTATPTPVSVVATNTPAPTAQVTPNPSAEPVPIVSHPDQQVVPGDANAWRHQLRKASANASISDKYGPGMAIDGDPGTSWQFSTKKVKLGKAYIELRMSKSGTVDELWLKNGFWRFTNGHDQYLRNSRAKKIGVSFLYNGANDFTDELLFTLRDDDLRQNWMIVPLGRHENVKAVRLRIISIYKGSKYPNDVALSEAMLIERDQPLTIRALKAGQKNEDVLAMKLRLQELGYFDADAKIDNQFNNATVNRVKGFQRVNGITATGEADIYTLALMFSGLAVGK